MHLVHFWEGPESSDSQTAGGGAQAGRGGSVGTELFCKDASALDTDGGGGRTACECAPHHPTAHLKTVKTANCAVRMS